MPTALLCITDIKMKKKLEEKTEQGWLMPEKKKKKVG